jgi:hypothetical protein
MTTTCLNCKNPTPSRKQERNPRVTLAKRAVHLNEGLSRIGTRASRTRVSMLEGIAAQ